MERLALPGLLHAEQRSAGLSTVGTSLLIGRRRDLAPGVVAYVREARSKSHACSIIS